MLSPLNAEQISRSICARFRSSVSRRSRSGLGVREADSLAVRVENAGPNVRMQKALTEFARSNTSHRQSNTDGNRS